MKNTLSLIAELIVEEWFDDINRYLIKQGAEPLAPGEFPDVMDFPPHTIKIELMDGSVVEFRYAFFLTNYEKKAIAVLTEHCGYHVFPMWEAKVYRDGVLAFEMPGFFNYEENFPPSDS